MIRLIQSTFYNEAATKEALAEFIKRADHLSFGIECEKFEQAFASYQQRQECVMVNSGSSANMAIIQSLLNLGWIKAGDKVGFSAVTWSTNVMPLIQLGLHPVPIDVSVETLNITKENLEIAHKGSPLKLLFITHLLGLCSDMEEIQKYCQENNILLVEDNCESLGSVYKGKKLGNFGLAATFSFYVGHHLSTIEGGAIVTDNQELADMLRIVRAHGWDRNLTSDGKKRVQTSHHVNSLFYSRYTFYDLGYNFRPTEINGFIGLLQLSHIDEIVTKRQSNFMKFAASVYTQSKLFYPLSYRHMDVISSFSLPLVCRTEETRERLVELCIDKIEVRPIVGGNITEQPFFSKHMGLQAVTTPQASIIHRGGLYMGNNPDLTDKQLNLMIATISKLGA